MPWTVADVDSKKAGLSPKQKRQWVAVANEVLSRTGDDAQAIRAANAAVIREGQVPVADRMMRDLDFREAIADAVDDRLVEIAEGGADHFYGAWSGGSEKSGGHPAGKAGGSGGGGGAKAPMSSGDKSVAAATTHTTPEARRALLKASPSTMINTREGPMSAKEIQAALEHPRTSASRREGLLKDVQAWHDSHAVTPFAPRTGTSTYASKAASATRDAAAAKAQLGITSNFSLRQIANNPSHPQNAAAKAELRARAGKYRI